MKALKYKPDFERAQKYWDAFWVHEIIDRPCTIIWAKTSPDAADPPRLQPITTEFQKTFACYDKHLETHAFLGECIPGFRPGFGPDQMAGFLGAPLEFNPNSPDTNWIKNRGRSVETWIVYWHIYLYVILVLGIGTTVWLTVGGFIDLGNMFRVLRSVKRNEMDDGTVVDHHIRERVYGNKMID